jgi:hypothetical protein
VVPLLRVEDAVVWPGVFVRALHALLHHVRGAPRGLAPDGGGEKLLAAGLDRATVDEPLEPDHAPVAFVLLAHLHDVVRAGAENGLVCTLPGVVAHPVLVAVLVCCERPVTIVVALPHEDVGQVQNLLRDLPHAVPSC